MRLLSVLVVRSAQCGSDWGRWDEPRVTDGWSQRALRKLLRMSRARLRQLIAGGTLRVRDPRITRASLASCCAKRQCVDPSSTSDSTSLPSFPGGPCSWKRAAKVLNLEVVDVQKLISSGQLKLVDTFVTDRAFEEFCRKHGSAVNLALIDPSTRRWLVSEYGVADTDNDTAVPRAQKHVLVVRECNCGRKIAGNVYFRHIRYCRQGGRLNYANFQINVSEKSLILHQQTKPQS